LRLIWGVAIIEAAGSSGLGEAVPGSAAILSLVYAPGQRPSLDVITAMAERDDAGLRFAISHMPGAEAGWVELLSGGLTYDCRGLAPGDSMPHPGKGALLGLHDIPEGETISLEPAPHLAEGRGMLPVVRVLAGLGAGLAQFPGLNAVYWQPARCWMAGKYFRGVVADWLSGGAFPALGLTSLQRASDGAMVSAGLDFLIGQELRFEPNRRLVPAAVARIAVRLIHSLIESGPLTAPAEFVGPEGERLEVSPMDGGRQLRVVVRR
jgi:hypothetical protein